MPRFQSVGAFSNTHHCSDEKKGVNLPQAATVAKIHGTVGLGRDKAEDSRAGELRQPDNDMTPSAGPTATQRDQPQTSQQFFFFSVRKTRGVRNKSQSFLGQVDKREGENIAMLKSCRSAPFITPVCYLKLYCTSFGWLPDMSRD